jgi:hypothetical protein
MSYKHDDPNFKAICQAAHKRVVAVLRCLDILVPDATPARKSGLRTRFSRSAMEGIGACGSRSSRLKP